MAEPKEGYNSGINRNVIGTTSASGEYTPAESSTGAIPTLEGVTGTVQTFVLNAIQAATDATANRIDTADAGTDSTGFKAFRVTPMGTLTSSVTALVYGFSTTAGDFTAVNAVCDTLITDITTPASAGQPNENALAIYPNVGGPGNAANAGFAQNGWVNWNGADRIKTIVVKSEGADQGAVAVEVIL